MKISDCMTDAVELMGPDDTVRDAAERMAERDIGAIPIAEDDRLVGIVTDRDIVVRALRHGEGPDCRLRGVMTRGVRYCFEDDDAASVARNMAELQVRRLPVVNRDKRLVGIVAIRDLALYGNSTQVGCAICGISRSENDTQSLAAL